MNKTSKIKQVPQIRFAGFTEVWEQRKLNEVCSISKGEQLGKASLSSSGKYYVLNGGMEPSGFTDTFNTLKNTISISEGGNSCGFVNWNEENFWSGGHNYTLSRVLIDSKYLYQFLKSIEAKIMALRVGSGLPNVQKSRLENLIIKYSINDDEQEKIGVLCDQLDSLITLHQCKCDKLKNTKVGLLSRMFPENENNVPKLRFEGFNEAWEQCKLGSISNIYDGTHQTPNYKDEGIMFLSVENIATLKSEKFISMEDFRNQYKNYPVKGDLLMTRIGDVGTANVVETDEAMAYYVSLALIKPKSIDSNFLSNSIGTEYFKKSLELRTLTSAIPKKINKDQIGEIDLLYPLDIYEQKKIGQLFKTLDHLITLHQRKLDKLKDVKKTLLQKMFI